MITGISIIKHLGKMVLFSVIDVSVNDVILKRWELIFILLYLLFWKYKSEILRWVYIFLLITKWNWLQLVSFIKLL